MAEQKSVYLETYGCTANQNNSEILAGILNRTGFIITNNPEISDIIIMNTCIVKSKTESKIKRRLQDLRKEFANKLIIIAGCMPETDFKKLKKLDSRIIFLGTHHFKDIVNLISDCKENKLTETKQKDYLSQMYETKLNLPKQPQNKLISIHQISEGCLGECSYCKTRFAKGRLSSYPKDEILRSIESDLQNGAKEIWLTSQDNAAYGLDQKEKKRDIPSLLKDILSLKHNFKIRLGMMDPNNVLPIVKDLLEIYKNKKMFRFLHIPIQSASNKILKNMNRLYTIEQAEKIIEKFKTALPEAVIATDIIVGYPTETQEDHLKNLEFINKYKPDVLNISKFSSHKNTPAGKLKVLPSSLVSKRASELMQAHRITAKENKQKYLEKTINVFINKRISEHLHKARDENYNIILLKCSKELLGKEVEVKITGIGVHNMVGELIEED